MDASQRLSELVEVLRRDGRVDVVTAAAEFGTAELTIRRSMISRRPCVVRDGISDSRRPLSHNLLTVIKEGGLLAAKAGTSQSTIARLESCSRTTCRSRTLARLAAALQVQPATLTPDSPPVSRPG